jgi:hypothetical protein
MQYVFIGTVRITDDDLGPGERGVMIGDHDIPADIDFPFGTNVTCGIADERWNGPFDKELGWGYSEYTVMSSDTLKVGSHDIIEILERYVGRRVTFFVSDGPINLLEGVIHE